MFDFNAAMDAQVRDLREMRRWLSRLIRECVRAAALQEMPVLEISYKIPNWRVREGEEPVQVARGRLVRLTDTALELQDKKRVHYIKISDIVLINGQPIPNAESKTPRQLGVYETH